MAILKKFLQIKTPTQEAAVGSKQFELENNLALNATSTTGVSEGLLKLDSSNVLQFLKLPRVSSDPTNANDIVRLSYLESAVQSAKSEIQLEIDEVENRLIAEEIRAKAEEARIEGMVESEEQRAMAAESALDIRIDGEIFRATQKEAEIEASVATKIPLSYIGAANGVAPLIDSKIPAQYLPAVAITDTFVVTTIAQRDALVPASVQTGDVVKVIEAVTSADGTKLPRTYIYDGSQFVELSTESDVDSVNGFVGHITLDSSNIAESGDYRYYTSAREAELLKRDGSASITGALMPDQDGIREFGNLGYRFSSVLTKEVRGSQTEYLSLGDNYARLSASGNLALELDQSAMGYDVQLKSGSDTALKMGQSGISLTRFGQGLTAETEKVKVAHDTNRKLEIGSSSASLEIDPFKQLYINDEVSRLMQGQSFLDLKANSDSYLSAQSGVVVSTAQPGFNSFAPTLSLGGTEGGMTGAKLRNGTSEFALNGESAFMAAGINGVETPSHVQVKNSGEIELYTRAEKIKLTAMDGVKFYAATGAYFDMSSFQIKNLLDPTDAQDAATKYYVDNAVQGGVSDMLGQPNGIATLDGQGKLSFNQIPAIAITDVFVVQNISARDSLTVEEGDVAKVIEAELAADGMTYLPRTYIYAVDNQSQIGSWIEISAESDVMSVAGKVGHVTLDTGDVSEKIGGPFYFTDARAKSAAVVDSIMGDEHDMAPSVHAAKAYIDQEVTSAKSYTDSQLDMLTVSMPEYYAVELSAQDISNGYIDLPYTPMIAPVVVRQGLVGRYGPNSAKRDFSFSGTRVTFINEWAVGGLTPIEAGDLVEVRYQKSVTPYLN